MVVQAFYNGITHAMRSTIDAVMSGSLMSKAEDGAYNLIEEMALNNEQRSSEKDQTKQVRGKFDVDAFTLLTVKMDAMTQ